MITFLSSSSFMNFPHIKGIGVRRDNSCSLRHRMSCFFAPVSKLMSLICLCVERSVGKVKWTLLGTQEQWRAMCFGETVSHTYCILPSVVSSQRSLVIRSSVSYHDYKQPCSLCQETGASLWRLKTLSVSFLDSLIFSGLSFFQSSVFRMTFYFGRYFKIFWDFFFADMP